MRRRAFLAGVAGLSGLYMGSVSSLAQGFSLSMDAGAPLMNPCGASTPATLRSHEVVRAAFAGLDMNQVWDAHAHLLGTGDSGSGCWINPSMRSVLYPQQYLQRKFFLSAACVDESRRQVDRDFVRRLESLIDEFPSGAKVMLFAFDQTYTEDGLADPARVAFHVPDAHAAAVARANPARFCHVASIHPYRRDAVETLERAVAAGAVAIKWLPSSMGMDPASPRCDAFYEALKRHDLPLITHAGQERAVKGAHQQHFGNPLRLRRPLEHGVRVVVAHCASMGQDQDTDRGGNGPWRDSFELFSRLMGDARYENRLFGDISAITQTNRADRLPEIVARREWHGRLLNGSDYPLPGVMPLFSVDMLAGHGWLSPQEAVLIRQLRDYNPLMFDFVLKRSLRIRGAALPGRIFETRRFFDRQTTQGA